MFRENNSHLQQSFITSEQWMNPAVHSRLLKSWAPVFYNNVFCKIDESIFSGLYCADNGRPNFPVNILLSIEYIKSLFDYVDEELTDQFYFNYQIAYAVGIRNVGELNLCPGTLYEFRRRIYEYAIENPNECDLIFEQFIELTKEFAKESNTAVNDQRMDSTMISANIKNAGRLALAFDVIEQALKALPKELMTEAMKEILEDGYKSKLLYKTKGNLIVSRLQEMLDICEEIVKTIDGIPEIVDLPAMKVLIRFIDEQTNIDRKTGKRIVKANKEIKANSLQSAYDVDATYRKKANKSGKGYVVNVTETCNENNSVQFITDYNVSPNVVSDPVIAAGRLPGIKINFDITDMYVDGGYCGKNVIDTAESNNIKMHFTDMAGKKGDDDRIPVNEFTFNEDKMVVWCPAYIEPIDTNYDSEKDKITAHFSKDICNACELKDKCCVISQVKTNKFSTTGAAVEAQEMRDEINADRKENTSKRVAIEGTNSELKRSHGLDDVKVRGTVKVSITTGLKVTACNFKRFAKYVIKEMAKKSALPNNADPQGIAMQL